MRIKIMLFSFIIVRMGICQEQFADKGLEIFCGSENYSNSVVYNLEPLGTIWDVV
jgi:hypothetical protein